MNKYEEKQQRIMEILKQRQDSISKIEHGLQDLSNEVKLFKKDLKEGMESIAECISDTYADSGKLKSIIDKKFDGKNSSEK